LPLAGSPRPAGKYRSFTCTGSGVIPAQRLRRYRVRRRALALTEAERAAVEDFSSQMREIKRIKEKRRGT
jgi:hypothetical protein